MVVRGGYSLLCAIVLAGSFRMVVDIWGEGAIHAAYRLCLAFPPSYIFESVLGYLVGPLMNLGLCPNFGPYPSLYDVKRNDSFTKLII
jgi:hypothetical protein